MALMTMENQNDVCICGHTLLAHVHYNGDLGLSDNATTYCGMPITENVGDCECSFFRKTTSPLCVCGHKIGFHVENEKQELECVATLGCPCDGYVLAI